VQQIELHRVFIWKIATSLSKPIINDLLLISKPNQQARHLQMLPRNVKYMVASISDFPPTTWNTGFRGTEERNLSVAKKRSQRTDLQLGYRVQNPRASNLPNQVSHPHGYEKESFCQTSHPSPWEKRKYFSSRNHLIPSI